MSPQIEFKEFNVDTDPIYFYGLSISRKSLLIDDTGSFIRIELSDQEIASLDENNLPIDAIDECIFNNNTNGNISYREKITKIIIFKRRILKLNELLNG